MNSKILKTENKEGVNLGTIKAMGGENIDSLVPRQEGGEFTPLRNLSVGVLKEIANELRAKRAVEHNMLNKVIIKEQIIAINNLIAFKINERSKSMIKTENQSYEVVQKGDKMKRINISKKEDGEYDIWFNQDVKFHKNGELLGIDKVALHNGGKLAIKINGEFVPTNTLNGVEDVGHFLEVLGEVEEVAVLLPTGINKNLRPEPIERVRRRVYSIKDDCDNELTREFVFNKYKGPKTHFDILKTYNQEGHYYEIQQNCLGMNFIGFEPNHIIVVGTEPRLQAIDKQFKRMNEEKGFFYNKTGQKLRPFNKNFVGRVSQDKYFSKEGDISHCLTLYGARTMVLEELAKSKKTLKAFRRGDTTPTIPEIIAGKVPKEMIELRRLSEDKTITINNLDYSLQKMLFKIDEKPNHHSNEEAQELIDIAHEQDGRQTIANIEHDLRFELRDLKSRTSTELFYLLRQVKEELFLESEEIYNKRTKRFKTINKYSKKEQALVNVLEGFKSSKEIEEHEGKGLTSDVNDLVTQEKTWNDRSYKHNKNMYSLKLGLLIRNQDPQNMKDLRIQKFPASIYKGDIEYVREQDEADRMLICTKEAEDFFGNKVETYEEVVKTIGDYQIKYVKALTEAGFLNRGGSRFTYLFSTTSPSYRDVPEEEYTHVTAQIVREWKAFLHYIHEGIQQEFEADCYIEALEEVKGFLRASKDNYFHTSFTETTTVNIVKEWKEFLSPNKKDEDRKGLRIRNTYKSNSDRNLTKFSDFEESFNKPQIVQGPSLPFSYVPTRATNTPKYGVFKPSPLFKGLSQRIKEAYTPSGKTHIPFPMNKEYKHKEYITYGKEINHMVFNPFYKKNLGKNSMRRRDNSSPYTILEEKDGVYKILMNNKTLYAKGNIKALDGKTISMAGTRKPSKETKDFIKRAVEQCVEAKFATVSGLALGCDTIAHQATIDKNGVTIAVLPSGFNHILPKTNQKLAKDILDKNGLLISEYSPDTKYQGKQVYSERNEILVSLSNSIVIFEAGNGTMNSFKHAKRMNKNIFVQACDSYHNKKIIDNGDGDILLI